MISVLRSKQAASLFFPMSKCSFRFCVHVRITIMVQFQEVLHAEIACDL